MQETELHSQTLALGQKLEDYRFTTVLGQGGFGITYKATDESLQRDVAIKEYLPRQFAFRDGTGRVQPRGAADEDLFRWGLARFVDEARALAKFRHPNIASVSRYFEANGTAYLVMEFEEGMDFGRWLAERGRPDEDRLVNGILIPVLEGLARVHDKGLLHRDIKPDNIFIRRDGTPVLIDFGASRPHGPQAATVLTSIISAGYSPFEQYGSGERQGPWSDLYALAGTMYRAIAGKAPVDAIQRHQGVQLPPAVEVGSGHYSKRLLGAIDRALSLEIPARPQSAREFLALLGVAMPAPEDADATYVRRDGAPRESPGPPRRRTALVLAGAVAVAAVLSLSTAYLLDVMPHPWQTPVASEATPVPGAGAEPVAETLAEPVAERQGAAAEAAGEPEVAAAQAPLPATDPARNDDGALASDRALTSDPAGNVQPVVARVSPPAPVDPLSEDLIWSGLDISSSVRGYRSEQLAGKLLAYTRVKTRFDDCYEAGCSELPVLVRELRETMDPETWRRDDAEGTIAIESPRRLNSDDCPFMLDVREQINVQTTVRAQVRTYCTGNGFDRVVQQAGDVI
jgi:serine/threonine protein kinase